MISDICVDHASNTHRLGVGTTLSRVREGHLREALVVNTSGAPFTIKHGMRLSPCLAYGTQVVSEPAEFPSICVSSIVSLREEHLGGGGGVVVSVNDHEQRPRAMRVRVLDVPLKIQSHR